jgi:COP9 signalosome complex subunit 6
MFPCAVKDVHKAPALDLVGWYTTLSTSGPQPFHLPIHRQILDNFNESAILLGFHPESALGGSVGGKLPLTIYESNYEADDTAAESGEDKEMKDSEPQLVLKFKELQYIVETGEAEMIGVDFVARGGGNATAVDSKVKPKEDPKGKGKTRNEKAKVEDESASKKEVLTREDEELIASLTAKSNAIKMLQARINLIAVYLQNLPPSYVSDSAPEADKPDTTKYTPVNHSVLRSIQSLLSRLSLLIPAESASFQQELMAEQNDVSLISLLSTMTQSIKDAREVGKKFHVFETGKHGKSNMGRSMESGSSAYVSGVGDLQT